MSVFDPFYQAFCVMLGWAFCQDIGWGVPWSLDKRGKILITIASSMEGGQPPHDLSYWTLLVGVLAWCLHPVVWSLIMWSNHMFHLQTSAGICSSGTQQWFHSLMCCQSWDFLPLLQVILLHALVNSHTPTSVSNLVCSVLQAQLSSIARALAQLRGVQCYVTVGTFTLTWC